MLSTICSGVTYLEFTKLSPNNSEVEIWIGSLYEYLRFLSYICYRKLGKVTKLHTWNYLFWISFLTFDCKEILLIILYIERKNEKVRSNNRLVSVPELKIWELTVFLHNCIMTLFFLTPRPHNTAVALTKCPARKFVEERKEFFREYLLNGFREIAPFTVSRYTSSFFFPVRTGWRTSLRKSPVHLSRRLFILAQHVPIRVISHVFCLFFSSFPADLCQISRRYFIHSWIFSWRRKKNFSPF